MSASATDHSHLLPWYIAGTLEPDQTKEVEAHLEVCPECRDEVRALASMRDSLLSSGGAHVSVADLVAYEKGASDVDLDRKQAVSRHLGVCDPCREDLEILKRARGPGDTPFAETRRTWPWAAAAAVTLLGIAAWMYARSPPPMAPAMTGVRIATFLPAQRGQEGERVLGGKGPWTVIVVLPLSEPSGEYRLAVARDNGTPVEGLEVRAPADKEGRLVVLIPALPGAGRYRMIVERVPGAPGRQDSYEYPFELRPAERAGAEEHDR